VLFQRGQAEGTDPSATAADWQPLQESITSFVHDMEEENEDLYAKLVAFVKEKDRVSQQQLNMLQTRVEQLENQLADLQIEPLSTRTSEEKSARLAESTTIEPSEPALAEPNEPSTAQSNDTTSAQAVDQQEEQRHQAQEDEQQASSFEENLKKAEELFNQGFTPPQIAKLLRIGNGEAQLIVHMLQRK